MRFCEVSGTTSPEDVTKIIGRICLGCIAKCVRHVSRRLLCQRLSFDIKENLCDNKQVFYR